MLTNININSIISNNEELTKEKNEFGNISSLNISDSQTDFDEIFSNNLQKSKNKNKFMISDNNLTKKFFYTENKNIVYFNKDKPKEINYYPKEEGHNKSNFYNFLNFSDFELNNNNFTFFDKLSPGRENDKINQTNILIKDKNLTKLTNVSLIKGISEISYKEDRKNSNLSFISNNTNRMSKILEINEHVKINNDNLNSSYNEFDMEEVKYFFYFIII